VAIIFGFLFFTFVFAFPEINTCPLNESKWYVCMYVVNEKKEKGNNYRKGRSAKGWV